MFIDHSAYIAMQSFSLQPEQAIQDPRKAAILTLGEEMHLKHCSQYQAIRIDVLQQAIEMTDLAVQKADCEVPTLAELILHSFYLFENGKYEACPTGSWTISEQCLNPLWKKELDELNKTNIPMPNKFINSERRKKLSGRDFTASMVTEILSLTGVLPFGDYCLANEVRQARNAWLHNLLRIDRAAAEKAIELAQRMLRKSGLLNVDMPHRKVGNVLLALHPDLKTD